MGSEIDAFLEMQVAERGASPNTVAAYRRAMKDVLGQYSCEQYQGGF